MPCTRTTTLAFMSLELLRFFSVKAAVGEVSLAPLDIFFLCRAGPQDTHIRTNSIT